MSERRGQAMLLKGNEAICEGAIHAGCRFFFGYPITPQNQIPEYMSKRLPEVGGVFLQGESELASINMVLGASAAGARAMTTSSSPGISLMTEGISYQAGCELPCVVVNVSRGGPGLGNIAAAQSDYLQATRMGHGDLKLITLLPWSVQELYDFTALAFQIADEVRSPVIVLADAILGQMMESMQPWEGPPPPAPEKPWALTGAQGREPNVINSLYSIADEMETVNHRIRERYEAAAAKWLAWEETGTEDAEVLLVSFGTSARVCRTALDRLRANGIRTGLLRPKTGLPYPSARLRELAGQVGSVFAVEMNLGQMLDDVRLAVGDLCPVEFVGRTGGNVPTALDIVARVEAAVDAKGGGVA